MLPLSQEELKPADGFLMRLLTSLLLAGLLGAMILVVAYAVGCLYYLAHAPYVAGRVFLAVRNSAIIVLSLALGYWLCRRLHRGLKSG